MKKEIIVKDFEREELQELRERADVNSVCANSHWQRAYERLADAADTLDGMMARSIDRE